MFSNQTVFSLVMVNIYFNLKFFSVSVFQFQVVFSLVMVNLISFPSLYSSDLTCNTLNAYTWWCWSWSDDHEDDADDNEGDSADDDGGADDNENDANDLAIRLDQLTTSMPVASNIGALSVNIIITVIILHCTLSLVRLTVKTSPLW